MTKTEHFSSWWRV